MFSHTFSCLQTDWSASADNSIFCAKSCRYQILRVRQSLCVYQFLENYATEKTLVHQLPLPNLIDSYGIFRTSAFYWCDDFWYHQRPSVLGWCRVSHCLTSHGNGPSKRCILSVAETFELFAEAFHGCTLDGVAEGNLFRHFSFFYSELFAMVDLKRLNIFRTTSVSYQPRNGLKWVILRATCVWIIFFSWRNLFL